MKCEQLLWTPSRGWSKSPDSAGLNPQLALIFAGESALNSGQILQPLLESFPSMCAIGCSTAGEVCGMSVLDNSVACTLVEFSKTQAQQASVTVDSPAQSFSIATRLAEELAAPDLIHVFVLSDGLCVNGSELARGFNEALPESVGVSGGLAADGDRFAKTMVFADGAMMSHRVSAIGFYGNALHVACGSVGGWDTFGPERLITRSESNVLFELDGKNALDLYRRYLGEFAEKLPSSALLFPLNIRSNDSHPVVRTILGVDDQHQSMTFAGDIPSGSYAQFMKANLDRLVEGAGMAARRAVPPSAPTPELGIVISCVGRRLVMGQRVEEEVEIVREMLGSSCALTGFYSYGELAPFDSAGACELHNQTMTVTTFSER